MYAADYRWWHFNIADIKCGFTGKLWSCETLKNTNWGTKSAEEWDVTLLHCETAANGLSRDPQVVHAGGNSGYQAINLALHLGATRIILLGFDMQLTRGQYHWFGRHGHGLANADPSKYIHNFRSIIPSEYGIEIINCTRETALDMFPRMSLEEAFNE